MAELPPLSSWLRPLRRPACPRLTLVAVPPAGSGASLYAPWQAHLPEDVALIAVQLPGRENRIREPLLTRFDAAVEGITSALATLPGPIDGLFGHSFGAILSFEVMRRMRRLSQPLPRHFFASGHIGPELVSNVGAIHELPREQFIAELRSFNGLVEEILAHPQLLDIVLPIVRSDLALDYSYCMTEEPPLPVPMTGLAGVDDHVAPPDQVSAWSRQSSIGFDLKTFPGSHFFIRDNVQSTVATILAALKPPVALPAVSR
ncbi:thioesterase [Corallococcus coralloides]|uniref:Thioesterase n=1 Tax=Corallococcus coralloides TaxID=184914 RepID=A0A410RQ34_CORCK|nr:alpha/beta fold hydrolase [Corallococcus coralloides]QAT84049.1 thioesterase [Corallococcus coralloides]